jgi:hypothetical protein
LPGWYPAHQRNPSLRGPLVTTDEAPMNIVVLSEDSGQGFETIAALLGRVLRLHNSTGRQEVFFLPAENRLSQEAAYANAWKSRASRDRSKKVSLVRTIATRLSLGDVVLFHYDGDTAWTTRSVADTPRQFDREIRTPVQQLLNGGADPSGAQRRSLNLIEVVPYYSIEAWTYQATRRAVEVCTQQYSGRDSAKFVSWEKTRESLDEIEQPKEQTCLGGRHNADLARHVPAAEVEAVGKLLHELLKRVGACPQLAPRVRIGQSQSTSDAR